LAAAYLPVTRAPLGADISPALAGTQEIQQVICPRGTYLVGFFEVLGYWLYEMRIRCSAINREGGWNGNDFQPPGTQFVAVGGLGAHGANDFLTSTRRCPLDSYVRGLTGVIVRVRDENASGLGVVRMPGLVNPVCGKRTSPVDFFPEHVIRDWERPQYQEIPWASFEEPEFVGWRGLTSPSTCQSDEVAIGVWGVRDSWLRSVGLVCDLYETVRPRTPVELGADELARRPVRREAEDIAKSGASNAARQKITGTLSPGGDATRAPVQTGLCKRNPAACAKRSPLQ